LGVAPHIDNEVLADLRQRRWSPREVRLQLTQIDLARWEPQHEPVRGPVCEVEKRVEVAGQQLLGISLEVAPLVLVPESRRRDVCARRYASQLCHLVRRERTI